MALQLLIQILPSNPLLPSTDAPPLNRLASEMLPMFKTKVSPVDNPTALIMLGWMESA